LRSAFISAAASRQSALSCPSVNQSAADPSVANASSHRPCRRQSRARLIAARNSRMRDGLCLGDRESLAETLLGSGKVNRPFDLPKLAFGAMQFCVHPAFAAGGDLPPPLMAANP
jgi:hypothetical protein